MELGQLHVVTPRDVFPTEPAHFSKWISENLDRLNEVLGLDLELLKVEAAVGPFALDILARVVDTQDLVIIENQIEQTDHRHLGQILTYAAGYDPKYVVWITPKFQEEHRAALDWLNTNTAVDRNFFGIQVEVLKIDDSRPAVNFRAIVLPNQWQKTVAQLARETESAGDQEELNAVYAAVYERAKASGEFPKLRLPPQRYSVYELEYTNQSAVYYAVAFGRNTVRAEVILRHENPDVNLALLKLLELKKAQIQDAVTDVITWDLKADRKIQALRIHHAIERQRLANDVDPVALWAADHLVELHRVLEPMLPAELAIAISDVQGASDGMQQC